MLKTILKTMLKYEKTPSHFTTHVEIEQQISFLDFDFTHVSNVRHIFTLKGNKVYFEMLL